MDDNTAAVEILGPLFALIILVGCPVAAFIIFRILAHRERMAMIRHGMVPPVGKRGDRGMPPPPAAGFAAQPMTPGYDASAQNALRKGITLTFVGFAITLGLSFIGYHPHESPIPEPGPWLLGGLVPLFIGLAQVVVALISGATLGNLTAPRPPQQTWTPGMGAPGAAPGYADPFTPGRRERTTYDESYTYRPGETPELRRATPPPERMP